MRSYRRRADGAQHFPVAFHSGFSFRLRSSNEMKLIHFDLRSANDASHNHLNGHNNKKKKLNKGSDAGPEECVSVCASVWSIVNTYYIRINVEI